MARPSALVLAVPLALLLAACGGDDGDQPEDPATTTSATVDAEAASFCDAFGAILVGPLAEGGFDPTVPDELRDAVGITAPIVDALRRGAPPELAEAAGAVADAYDRAFAVLERYGYDLARVDAEATPQEQRVLDDFGRPPVGPGNLDPYDEVEAFVADRCAPGVTVPPDLTATTSP